MEEIKIKTLTETLMEKGYIHKKSKTITGKQDVYKNDEFIGTFTASQCWEWIKREEKVVYIAESIALLNGIKCTEGLKEEIRSLTDNDLEIKLEFAEYLEGK